MVIDKSKVIENRLDTTKYRFAENWPQDSLGIPTPKYYRQEGCATFDYYLMKLTSGEDETILEMK